MCYYSILLLSSKHKFTVLNIYEEIITVWQIEKYTVQYTVKEFDSMVFSIRLTVQEKKIVESYVRMHSISLGEAFKQALFEKNWRWVW